MNHQPDINAFVSFAFTSTNTDDTFLFLSKRELRRILLLRAKSPKRGFEDISIAVVEVLATG
ncbi:hypothetical protein DERP_011621 [Dermatophagoides pteronyssinus]|uniref:Uncharacterized protein n=1 Tax=Dermatophagoides pteronyssinus TaxID=6956 RepID=A0ABQ8JWP4_DERPT|nr:hypothetical protein DERP_011621 [Dermatophagoides pteronyssinus]